MFSLVANLCIAFSLAVIFYEMIFLLTEGEGERVAAVRRYSLLPVNIGGVPLYFGSAVYAFEGIGVVSTVEHTVMYGTL